MDQLASHMERVYMDMGVIQQQANVECRRANLNEKANVNRFIGWSIIPSAD